MIQSTSPSDGTQGLNPIVLGSQAPAQQSAAQGRDSLSTEQADQLRAALAQQPEIRPEMLAKGRALAADPNYPPSSIINGLASLLVNSDDSSEESA
jgi:hypothetical protein